MNDSSEVLLKLSASVDKNAKAIELLTDLITVLVEAMPAKVEGDILGISQPTVRRNREKRRNARLMR